MKSFAALCLFGVIALTVAMPHRPERPPQHHPRPPMGHEEWPMEHPDLPTEVMELIEDFHDFMHIMPMRRIERIVKSYMRDPAFRQTLEFLQSPAFEETMTAMSETEEFKAIAQYLENAPWPWISEIVTEELRSIQTRANQLTVLERSWNAPAPTGGLSGLIDEVVAVLPMERLAALFEHKMENRATFRSVMEIVYSSEMKALVNAAKDSEAVKGHLEVLLEHGFDLVKIWGVFGY